MAFNNTVVARSAAAIWGLKLGFQTTQYVLNQANVTTGGLNAVINSAYNDSYGGTSDAAVAAVVVANLGLTGTNATAGAAYIVSQLAAAPAGTKGSVITSIVSLFATDPSFATLAAGFNAQVAGAVAYSSTAGTQDAVLGAVPSAASFNLTTGQDSVTGTAGNDTFNAFIFDNQNTLQSGDSVDGGAGNDTVYADMGASQNFAVTPSLVNVENFLIRGQSRANDSGDNNVANAGRVDVDAQRIVGATRFESNNSRADVIVEDVRILSSQITKDITVAFVSSDPGNVDYGLYFDQYSLTANRTNSSTLTIQVLDTASAAVGKDPLLNSPYDGYLFNVDGVQYNLKSQAINDATTYAQLVAALQVEAAKDTRLNGVSIATGGTFTVTDPTTGTQVTGTSIILSATNRIFTTGSFVASSGVPANSGLFTNQIAGTQASTDLVTSTIVLDDVGRGALGGDLVVGSLATGLTGSGTPPGVERFEITVEKDSRVQTINSTANSLKEVTIKNGTAKGLLTVNGSVNAGGEQLPNTGGNHDTGFGFVDVRLIDASAMTGAVSFTAGITTAAFAKYIPKTDTGSDPKTDNTSTTGKTTAQVADFIYSGGSGNDTINVQIDGAVVASASTVQVGREDFSFNVNGNAGNDSITVRVVDKLNTGLVSNTVGANWYLHQKDLSAKFSDVVISGGDGNDTIRKFGAGDTKIFGGNGNDTIYTDNTGAQAVTVTGGITNTNSNGPATGQRAIYTFNTDNNSVAPGVVLARKLNDIKSDANDSYKTIGIGNPVGSTGGLYKADVVVTFKGISSKVTLPANVAFPSDLYVNQAIKQAINTDPVLSKLISAEDGPEYSLVVKSLIDGVMTTGDLAVVLTAANTANLSATDLSLLSTTYAPVPALGASVVPLTTVQIQAALTASALAFTTGADYATNFGIADDGTTAVVGAASITPSSNTITPGAGNDVIVLGTTLGGAADTSSHEKIVYSGSGDADVIINFQVGGFGADTLDLSALGGSLGDGGLLVSVNAVPTAGSLTFAALTQDESIYVVKLDSTNLVTAAQIAALFVDSGSTTVAHTAVVILVNQDATTLTVNNAFVWSISDPINGSAASSNVTATLMGSIDLGATDWFTLNAGSFA